MRLSRLFRSRWAALWWAGGVLWFAFDVAGGAPKGSRADKGGIVDASGAAVNAADVAAIVNAAGL
ncbi:hypothetical protein [Sphingomonas sp.]|uniref:hypothetical protein n=1 Tax=Sphingomonas sp. TaxID=28214 RepID=UPI0035C7EC8D